MSEAPRTKSIFVVWLESLLTESDGNTPRTVYHYTNAGGLHGIMSSGAMWATDVRFLNDSVEFLYGRRMFSEALETAATNCSYATQRHVETLTNPNFGFLQSFAGEAFPVYVACFCEQGDLLSQWRGYGGSDRFGGYSLGFTPRSLAAWGQPAEHTFTIRRVIYDESEQRRICTALAEPLVQYLDSAPNDRNVHVDFNGQALNGVTEIASWMKHPAFAEEREWRLIYLASPTNPLPTSHRVVNGLFVPYVEVPVKAIVGAQPEVPPITEIFSGPCEDNERKMVGLRSRVGNQIHDYPQVEFRYSSAPARI